MTWWDWQESEAERKRRVQNSFIEETKTPNPKGSYAYLGLCKTCNAKLGMCLDDEERKVRTAQWIGQFVKDGLWVQRVPLADDLRLDKDCGHHE